MSWCHLRQNLAHALNQNIAALFRTTLAAEHVEEQLRTKAFSFDQAVAFMEPYRDPKPDAILPDAPVDTPFSFPEATSRHAEFLTATFNTAREILEARAGQRSEEDIETLGYALNRQIQQATTLENLRPQSLMALQAARNFALSTTPMTITAATALIARQKRSFGSWQTGPEGAAR